MTTIVAGALALVVLGACVYCVLAIEATRRYLQVPPPVAPAELPGISILKPLHGAEDGLRELLRTFFTQDYPHYELIFATRVPADPACAVVAELRREFPHVPARLLHVGEPPWPNAKVWSLHHLLQAAQYELVAMCDSDVRVGSRFLRTVAAEFADPAVMLTTCPYRAVPGASCWSRLEAVGMNTEFLAGVLTARLLDGMKFALGPTICARKAAIAEAGGMADLREFLAEDFVLGNRLGEAGRPVLLSRYVIEHHIGSQPFRKSLGHRLRWCRSTRRSRPAGYVGQVFTNPLPLALLVVAVQPAWWPILVPVTLLRAMLGWATAEAVLHDPLSRRWWLVPLQDVLSFALWAAGLFGDTIQWRGEQYRVLKDGRFVPVTRSARSSGQ